MEKELIKNNESENEEEEDSDSLDSDDSSWLSCWSAWVCGADSEFSAGGFGKTYCCPVPVLSDESR